MYESWLFPVLETLHLIGMAILVGTIVWDDMRIWRGEASVRDSLFWWGLLSQAATGPVLFLANMPRYQANAAFQVKMALLALAVAVEFGVKPRFGRFGAALSIFAWSSVVIAARLIADFDQ